MYSLELQKKKKATQMLKILSAITFVFTVSFGSSGFADDHQSNAGASPSLMEGFECNLNKGVSLEEMIAFGRNEFASLMTSAGIELSTFVWEPLSIAPPYDETDFRWFNYYPSWQAYQAADTLWYSKGNAKNRAKLDKLAACGTPIFNRVHGVVQTESSLDGTDHNGDRILIGLCNVTKGMGFADVRGYITPELSKNIREAAGADRGQFLMVPAMGINAEFDFLNTLYATPVEMAKLLDAGREGKLMAARAATTNETPPYNCHTWHLHKSHRIIQGQ